MYICHKEGVACRCDYCGSAWFVTPSIKLVMLVPLIVEYEIYYFEYISVIFFSERGWGITDK